MAVGAGNAAKRQKNDTPGPWIDWTETNRAERAIRFVETYCRPPKGHGAGEPMRLSPEQKEYFRDILADGITMAIKSCMRGEGKSTEMAALALWATFDKSDSGAPQVPIIATTVNQAIRSVYGVAVAMVKAEPALEDRCTIYTAIGASRIEVSATTGTCFPMANDPDGLQGLDPSLAIVDEIGFQPIETWNSVMLASGKRPTSLVVGTGTPGLHRNNALWIIRSRILEEGGPPEGMVYLEVAAPENCDYTDERVWIDASPALRQGYKRLQAVRTIFGVVPESHFRIFQLGQWVEGTDAWLGPDGRNVWNSLILPHEFDVGDTVWCGLDVGVKRDSTALITMQLNHQNGKFHAKSRIWMPKKDDAVDITAIMQAIRQVDSAYDLKGVAYDPRLFELPAIQLRDEGLPMIETPQSVERMAPMYANLLQGIKDGAISHDGDDQFTQQILNGVPRYADRGSFTLTKLKSNGKIDAAVALAMCYDLASQKGRVRPPLCVF